MDHTRGKNLKPPTSPVPRRGRNSQTSVVQGSGSGSGSGYGNAQPTSSNVGPAMFDSATNTMINDGHFTTHQGDHTSVTVNIHGRMSTRTSSEIHNQSSPRNVVPSIDTILNRHRARPRPSRPEGNMILPAQRSNKIYERHLMLKDRGFPLWIPQPNMRLPIPYRVKGVCIGDVGIITGFGGFDFLFNICRARDDPINPEELPDNFTPIHPPLNPIDVREFQEFSSGSYLASSSIVESQTAEQNLGLTFESSASEGAILTMPEGAFQEELGNLSKFRNYVALHATDWYKFVNGPRGREAQNGDVRLVVGCDKTTTWGMATFANSSSGQQRLKFRPLRDQQQPQHNSGSAYAWEHSGVAEVRVGPEPGEDEELGETQTGQRRNQCLFMRTLSVTLTDSVWAATFPETVSSINQEGSPSDHRDQDMRPPNPNTTRFGSSSSNPASVQGTRRSLIPSKSVVAEEENNDNEEGSTPTQNVPLVRPFSAPANDIRDSDDIVSEKLLRPTAFVDKLYRIINDPESAKYVTWTDSGTSFIIWDVQIAHLMGAIRSDNIIFILNGFSNFMRQLHTHGFHHINRIHHSTENQSWEVSHPKFICGRPDLLHEIKEEIIWGLAMKDGMGSLGDAPTQLAAMQNESMRVRDPNPSKIINKYLLEQVPYAKIALTHDKDWSHVAKKGLSYLDPSKLIEQVIFLNDITVDIESGIVFFEPKDKLALLTFEERNIIDRIKKHHTAIEHYLFGSTQIYSRLSHHTINELLSDDMSFLFTEHPPRRPVSLDDLVDVQQNNLQSLLKRRRIHSLRSGLDALPLQHSDRGPLLLHLANALSRRFWQLKLVPDLEEAISYYRAAVFLLPRTHYHFLEATLGFRYSLYRRFQLLRHPGDLRELLRHLHTERDLDLQSLLTPVQAQLQGPRQVINKFRDFKFSNPMEGLDAAAASSNIDDVMTETSTLGKTARGRTGSLGQKYQMGSRGSKGLETYHGPRLNAADETIHDNV